MVARKTQVITEAVMDSQGRVRLPDPVRELAGLGPGDRVAIVARADGKIRLTKASDLLGPIIGSAPGLTAAATVSVDNGTGNGWHS
jgi:AbrB family looped-hinge helix DNA binding protein